VCQELGIVTFNLVGEVTDNHDIPNMYPSLFQGLGKLDSVYDIKLEVDAEPYAVFTPRCVPLPLQSKVKVELDRLQRLDVIIPVDEPTPCVRQSSSCPNPTIRSEYVWI